ncbi:MAG: winged helix-turn-helix domain-containing protein [Geminicoccaceae bacterium]
MARIFVRVDLMPSGRVGPGKIALLEEVDRTGSISAAGRALGMSYRRAWMLIDQLNQLFVDPVVTTQMGGSHGGGAKLTEIGHLLVARYRELETECAAAADRQLEALKASVRFAEEAASTEAPTPESKQRRSRARGASS